MKIKRKGFVLAMMLISTLGVFSQEDYQDEVHLKGRSVIKGNIIEHIPHEFVKVETEKGDTFLLSTEKTIKIVYKLPAKRYNYYRGYQGVAETGFGIGIGEYGTGNFRLNVINGYKFGTNSLIGLGIGVRAYIKDTYQAAAIPIFAYLRGGFGAGNVSPYLSMGLGYSFKPTYEPIGVMANPSIGLSIKFSRRNIVNLGLGYEMQVVKAYTPFIYEIETGETIGSIIFNVGIAF